MLAARIFTDTVLSDIFVEHKHRQTDCLSPSRTTCAEI
jgi:hypothetical protein